MLTGNKDAPYILVPTHDLDLLSVRELPWRSRTLWGLLAHSMAINTAKAATGRLSAASLFAGFKFAASVPLLKAGIGTDPIESATFDMIELERELNIRSTIYVMPYRSHPGHITQGHVAPRNRACFYDPNRYSGWMRSIADEGWEIGVHGIDSHFDARAAQTEKHEIENVIGRPVTGMRSHWLYHNGEETFRILRDAGYLYDASIGSNDTVGWNGNGYFPYRAEGIWVLPMTIHDGPLLRDRRLGPSWSSAKALVTGLLEEAKVHHGVVTILWHNSSFAVPRSWGEFYRWIIMQAQKDGAEIMTAHQVVTSLAQRRASSPN